ncbi:MAG: DNA polymerase III subunit delta [Bacteroidetes bacterium]|nr:MAG: DNA polymerase III subunit delta [Bacteroidota bacterium]
MPHIDILHNLKNKIYKPIYFLMGEETYYIDLITDYIINNVLTDAEKAFNQTILYGKDSDITDIIHAASRFPMMANNQVIVVKEAQNLKKIENLIHYAEKPLNSTMLVINYKYKTLDKRKKLYKVLQKTGVIVDFKKKYENEIPAWIDSYLKHKKVEIEPSASILLAEYLGVQLSKISNELDKLILTLPKGETKITSKLIEKNIGISKDYNVFELQKALGKKDVLKSNRIINYFAQNQKNHNITMVISLLYSYFIKVLNYHFIKDKSPRNVAVTIKINPYFISDYKTAANNYSIKKIFAIISYFRTYDLKSKGVESLNTNAGELLKELIYKILH